MSAKSRSFELASSQGTNSSKFWKLKVYKSRAFELLTRTIEATIAEALQESAEE